VVPLRFGLSTVITHHTSNSLIAVFMVGLETLLALPGSGSIDGTLPSRCRTAFLSLQITCSMRCSDNSLRTEVDV
jgi:hypothetical protein